MILKGNFAFLYETWKPAAEILGMRQHCPSQANATREPTQEW
ncbi:hypothetical protein FHX62_005539 [Cupriavidus alkaliphilus]|nr:hypothetical protein [Cupriavidus alkaliphilus]